MSAETTSRPRFAVVTDSTSDLTADVVHEHAIDVVPLSVTIGDATFRDGELSQTEFFARMKAAPQLPTTSQPPIGAFAEAYERALSSADEVVSVHISNRLSGTIEAARQAAEGFGGRVHVFDSLNLSWALGFQVLEAARAATEGLSAADALARIERVRERVRLIVGLDSLDNLAKGGRIGRVSAFLGGMLSIKVTLRVDTDGAFQPLGRSRGEKAALQHTLDWVAEQMGSATRGSFAVGHALSFERAEWLRDRIAERYDVAEMYVYEAGAVICTHTGTGWGIAVLPAE